MQTITRTVTRENVHHGIYERPEFAFLHIPANFDKPREWIAVTETEARAKAANPLMIRRVARIV